MEFIVGDIVEGEVVDFASGGEGVLKVGAYPIFVPFAIVGEVVRARITFAKKDCAWGDLIEVLSLSNDRIKPRCPYYGRCGGCSLQHLSHDKQLEIKRQNVVRALKKNAGLDCDVNDVVSVNEWEYRNKLSMPFGYRKKSNRVVLGFYEKRSHAVVPMKWCPLHGEWCSNVIEDVCEWANENGISVYDESTGKGVLRHVVARMLDTLALTIVVNARTLDKIGALAKKLDRHFENYAIYVSSNMKNSNVILGDDVCLVYGKEKKQNLGKFSAVVSPKSFLQVNNDMRDRIYDDVCKSLSDFDGDIVELYSGVGLLTAQIALRLEKSHIVSVEIVKNATENARALMKSLCIEDRVECVCQDATDFVKSLKTDEQKSKMQTDLQKIDLPDEVISSPFYLGDSNIQNLEDINNKNIDDSNSKNIGNSTNHSIGDSKTSGKRALILDPPRKGCDQVVLQSACDAQFERIAYISCNPQTLARDLKILCTNYDILSVTPYDMFPQTDNVETLAILRCKRHR